MKKLMLIAVVAVALLAPCSQGQYAPGSMFGSASQSEVIPPGGSRYGMDTSNIGQPRQQTECISPLGQFWRKISGWFTCRLY